MSQRGVEASSINDFNEWIADLDFVETPNVGRSFTWLKPNGVAKSRLDRILVSHQWLHKWPDSTSFTLDRNFSDHCPILLRAKITDWGPKPFRVFDCWLKEKSFEQMVKQCWSNTQPTGWGGFALKVKIKKLKEAMKVWNREQFGDSLNRVQRIEDNLNKLEDASSSRQLSS